MFSLKNIYMFIMVGASVFAVIRIIEQGEYWVPFLLRDISLVNWAWVLYYVEKSNGTMTIRNKMQKGEERLYLKSFMLFLYASTVIFILTFIGEIVMRQNRGILALMSLSVALVCMIFCLYKVIRIVTTAWKWRNIGDSST